MDMASIPFTRFPFYLSKTVFEKQDLRLACTGSKTLWAFPRGDGAHAMTKRTGTCSESLRTTQRRSVTPLARLARADSPRAGADSCTLSQRGAGSGRGAGPVSPTGTAFISNPEVGTRAF